MARPTEEAIHPHRGDAALPRWRSRSPHAMRFNASTTETGTSVHRPAPILTPSEDESIASSAGAGESVDLRDDEEVR